MNYEYFDSTNPHLRKLLLIYKYKSLSIEEAVEIVNSNFKLIVSYISDEIFRVYIIPNIIKDYSLNPKLWYSKNKKKEIIKYAQMLMYAMFVEDFGGKRSLSQVGRVVRGRDHATVLHAKKTVQGYLDTDPEFVKEYKEFKIYLIKLIKLWNQKNKDKKE